MEPEDLEFEECIELAPDTPEFRVTLKRSGSVRIVDWAPWLTTSGPLHTLFPARGRAGVTIADLTVLRDDAGNAIEVVVDFLCEGAADHRDALAVGPPSPATSGSGLTAKSSTSSPIRDDPPARSAADAVRASSTARISSGATCAGAGHSRAAARCAAPISSNGRR